MEKFSVYTQIHGSSWRLSVTEGSFEFVSDFLIEVHVLSGSEEGSEIHNKIFYLPAESTVISKNAAQRGA